ncbi:hypothetical protein AVEN_14488-1 [Araneus ventricosus]|uniref:Pre-C2HC domain-containing protein n=1 Tax=Araneus ventricosus TaxID=182803 RepID=A0A4Y2UZL1_ARAVE|nr:hypothetical protein AVEN_14488-1 [Araneus ventricosus]
MLKYVPNYEEILEAIQNKFGLNNNKLGDGVIKIYPENVEMYQAIQRFCKTQGYECHVIIPKNERPFRVVVKGLGLDYDTEKLKNILVNQGVQVSKITRLTQQRNRQPLPFYLVELVKTANVETIYRVNRIGFLKIEIEEFRARKQITQCFNCNGFGHSALGCGYRPRCLKCNGAHRTNQCSIKDGVENPRH